MEKNQNKKGLKKIILLLLLFVGLGASITAGAYWASLYTIAAPTAIEKTYTVNIGEGDAVEVTTELVATGANGETKELVPTGKITDSDTQTDTVSFDITVNWNRQGTDHDSYTGTGTLEATTVSILNPADEDVSGLFDVTYSVATNPITLGGSPNVTVTVVFANEPADVNEYNQVAKKALSLKVQFAVTSPTPTP